MFNQTKYSKWYFQIVNRAECREKPQTYCERHHKVPKSMGGLNDKSNLVLLTAREHLICHLLLVRMVIDAKHKLSMTRALGAMLVKNKHSTNRHIPSSRTYALIRQQARHASALLDPTKRFNPANADAAYRQNMSETLKGREAPWRKGAVDSEETRLKKSVAQKKRVFSQQQLENMRAAAKTRKRPIKKV